MKRPSFSICIPNYNYARYVGQTIQSVLEQTYQNFEIIVADNASTDNSIEVIEAFRDPRIRLIRNRYNIGFAPNLQRVSMEAKNDFINLLSADDLMKPTALAEYAAALESQGERAAQTVLISDIELIDSAGNVAGIQGRDVDTFEPVALKTPANGEVTLHRGKDILAKTLKRLRTFAPFLSVTYPRGMWQEVEGYNSVRVIGPDKHFNYKLLALDPDVAYVHRPLFQYRVHITLNAAASQQTLKQQIDDYLNVIETPQSLLTELGITRADLVAEFLDRVCLKNGLTQLVYGSYIHAARMLGFAFASFPAETLRRPRAYMLAGLLMLGPLAKFAARPLYNLYRRNEE